MNEGFPTYPVDADEGWRKARSSMNAGNCWEASGDMLAPVGERPIASSAEALMAKALLQQELESVL